MSDWRNLHEKLIGDFLISLNRYTDSFILKGGTAMARCYGLDRFSEDIDLDGYKQDIGSFVKAFCATYGYKFREAKNTELVKRYFIYYGNDTKPLKVEVSYRDKNKSIEERSQITETIGGIKVYSIDVLAMMKSLAYQGRDKIRDLYDLCFICEKYINSLSPTTKAAISSALAYRGLDQFEYLIATQKDPLIDENKLLDKYLKMHENLGLLVDKQTSTPTTEINTRTKPEVER